MNDCSYEGVPERTKHSASLDPEELLDRGDGAGRVFLFGCVAELLEDHEGAAGDLAMETFGVIGRNQPVAPAPENERRQLQLRDALGKNSGPPLFGAFEQRPAIAGALGELD